ncbi:LysR family transcriptional regulator [Enterobacillus tribolii]|uniref:DNA-binding transcriptional LysR family regulator n=1 Tax=Enterobacillus tribolii TaxID=1487935 RepID=A0A370QNW2_9GAMM|nr:LysR family transcriptional regulator [Enterobacillus tribolii]RDK90066.1 DNA-binding transcriptional LysR family regulator [Enterobacillus tribolii]
MNNKIDLNLARSLCEVIDTRSVSLAASRLKTNASTISTNLAKLRKHYNNPLFFRQGNGMLPTALALELYKKFRPALELFEEAENIELLSGSSQELPKLRVSAAPLIDLIVSNILFSQDVYDLNINWDMLTHPDNLEERIERVKRLQVDIDFGVALPTSGAYLSYPIYSCGLKVLCRKGHPRLQGKISLEQYKKEKIAGLIPPDENLGIEIPTFTYNEDFLLARNYRYSAALTMIMLVSQQNLITFVPSSIAPWICDRFGLQILEPDFPVSGEHKLCAHVHRSKKNDPMLKKIIDSFIQLVSSHKETYHYGGNAI